MWTTYFVKRKAQLESGLSLSQRIALIPVGADQEFGFETVIRDAVVDGRMRLRLVPQPGLEAVDLSVNLTAPGWDVTSPTSWQGAWDPVRRFDWAVHR